MSFSRPVVLSRGWELFGFGFAAFQVLTYAILAAMSFPLGRSDDLLKWIAMVGFMLPSLVLGYSSRRERLRKVAELREYERVLESLAD